ncbi:MAG TPA: TIM-barrel domain-containing protein [Bacteroidota bacterium]|nr:TIM-barrel domain-containing protein [Bacteroidota bacterium]
MFIENLPLAAASFQKFSGGILCTLDRQQNTEPRFLKIQLCAPDIVHVLATADSSFSHRPSLMVERTQWKPVHFTVNEMNDTIFITTSKIKIAVHKKTGAIAFYDLHGKIILKEKSAGGKIFTPANVLGEQTYHIQQIFESDHDEAYYGLGGHQNAVINYKNHDVDLWQHNMVESIPFLVSNNNYGILWDNTSHTKFGDIREYEPLSSLKLFSGAQSEGGLTVEYFHDITFNTLYTSRIEPRIAYECIDETDTFPTGFQQNVSAVRWSGEIQPSVSGIHKFRLYGSGYVKMWLDGKLVVNFWRQNWNPWFQIIPFEMIAGQRYKLKIEWIHCGGYIGLKHLSPEDEIYQNNISLYSEVADQIDYYFIHGNNFDEVIHGYRELTGKAPMMPNWALGLWQSREHYNSQEEILSTVKEFRRRHIPLDNIVQDWFYWKEDQWGSQQFDIARYPNAKKMIDTLHRDLHTHFMISVWAKFYEGIANYKLFNEHPGWLYMRNIEKQQKDWVGPGYVSTFYDAYNADARKLFWSLINENLFAKGIDAWWLDCSEPDIQSNLSRTETILRQGPTALGSPSRYLNAFSLLNAKGIYEGQRAANDSQRVFILTRSAFAGIQRYASTTWSGDLASRWYDLKAQISSGVNFCLSGVPYWSMDIGGFAPEERFVHPDSIDLEEWRELNTRWFQFGTFVPIFRVHGEFPYREMYNIAPENHPAYQSQLKYDKLRYCLMPYIYSLAGMVTHNDYTLMRGLVMDFGSDKNVLNINDQYMFGPSFLINPITEYKARNREVYLPASTGWYDFHSGKYFEGGQIILADAPYTDIPIFIKEGSIIPCGPEIQYTTEKRPDTLRIFVFTGKNASFTVYEDEGTNYNYEKGKFSTIKIQYDESQKELTFEKRQGMFNGMLEQRTFEIVFIDKQKPSGIDFQSKPDTTVSYDGSKQTVPWKSK